MYLNILKNNLFCYVTQFNQCEIKASLTTKKLLIVRVGVCFLLSEKRNIIYDKRTQTMEKKNCSSNQAWTGPSVVSSVRGPVRNCLENISLLKVNPIFFSCLYTKLPIWVLNLESSFIDRHQLTDRYGIREKFVLSERNCNIEGIWRIENQSGNV